MERCSIQAPHFASTASSTSGEKSSTYTKNIYEALRSTNEARQRPHYCVNYVFSGVRREVSRPNIFIYFGPHNSLQNIFTLPF